MKLTLRKLGTGALYIFAAPLMLLLIVALIPLIFGGMGMNAYLRILSWMRHDPRHVLSAHYRIYTDNEYPASEQGVGDVFDKYLALIKEEVPGPLEVAKTGSEHDDRKIHATSEDVVLITLTASIRSKYGVAVVEMNAAGGSGDNKMFSSSTDGDFPPYLHVVYKQKNGLRTVFDIRGSDALEFLVASLSNGQVISQSGQIWAKLKQGHYIVNYTVRKSVESDRLHNEYGYRTDFSHARVRMYLFDKKS